MAIAARKPADSADLLKHFPRWEQHTGSLCRLRIQTRMRVITKEQATQDG